MNNDEREATVERDVPVIKNTYFL